MRKADTGEGTQSEEEDSADSADSERSPYSDPSPKNKRKAPSGLSGIEKKIYFVIQDHSTLADDKDIKDVFSKYAFSPKAGSGDSASSQQSESAEELTEENAYMAALEVLRAWSLELDNAADSKIYQQYFEPTWKRYATKRGTVIGADQSVDFMRAFLQAISTE